MATIGNSYLSLVDTYRRQHRDDTLCYIIEQLTQRNDMFMDAAVTECNEGRSHLATIRTGLPTPTWRKLYQGVQPTKSTTAQVRDTTGHLEDWTEIDSYLVQISTDKNQLLFSEALAKLQGMANELAATLIYGDTATDPEKFTGLAPRFSSLSAENGGQIIDAGGTGSDNTSIWFVVWGPNTCQMIYPRGTMAGIDRRYLGEETKEKTDGTLYRVHRELFTLDAGVSLANWQGVARIANIDVSNLTNDPNSGFDIVDAMIQAYHTLDRPSVQDGRLAIYCNRTINSFLHRQGRKLDTVYLTPGETDGMPKLSFLGAPIRQMDAILDTEAQVT